MAITRGLSLDVLELDAASNRRIDDIRALRENIPLGTAGSRYKVIIVDEVHMLTTEAFNALLKTLEEPPAHVVFILATTDVHKVPATIISRCQRFDFHRVAVDVLLTRLNDLIGLEKIEVDNEVLRRVAYLAQGSVRDAESLLGKVLGLGGNKIDSARANLVLPKVDTEVVKSIISALIKREAALGITILNDYLNEGGELSVFYSQVLNFLRLIMLYKLGGQKLSEEINLLAKDEQVAVAKSAEGLTMPRLQFIIETWSQAENSWKQSEIPQLNLELAIITICTNGTEIKEVNNKASNGSQASAVSQTDLNAEVPQNSSAEATTPTDLTLESIKQLWPQVIAKLKPVNHSLSFILSMAEPKEFVGRALTISFQYKLHKERLADSKINLAVEKAVAEIMGTTLKIKSIVSPEPTTPDLFSSVLNTFGGQVVDG